MTTTYQQTEAGRQSVRRRATSKGLSFGPLATAITVGFVMLLLGVTFVGDWLRTPTLAVEASPSIISPNGDNVQDGTNFSYTLNEDADVVVQVVDQNGNFISTIQPEAFQTRGQHVAMWDGRDNIGQVVPDGTYQVQVTGMGTMRAAQQFATVMVDTVPPTLRLANLDNNARVREANFTVDGLTDPDAVVQLENDAQMIPVDAEGQFSLKRQLTEGTNNIQLIATDPAGNVTTMGREVALVTQPPEIAINGPTNDLWTNESLISVSGVAPAGTLLKVNGQEATVAETGAFDHEVILQEGDNTVMVEATDDVGNTTSQELIVHRKTVPPILSLNVEDTSTFQQSEIQVMGQTDAGSTVTIGGQAVSVSPLGEFQTTVQLLKGENMLEVVAQDQAGNLTSRQKVINFEVLPPQPEWMRAMNNIPNLSNYMVPAMISLPVLLILAYFFTRPVSLMLSSESATFRPGLPEEGRFLRLALDLSKPAKTTVEVRDRRGNTVATLQHRRHRSSGQQSVYWNGYDDFGRMVSPGEYTINATARTAGGSVTSMVNISVTEDQSQQYQYLRNSPRQDQRQKTQADKQYVRRGPAVQRVR
ncbi:FlgD immunoglobulin-like domain containing protein [Anaerolineales bacterium HSG25]|nr:FlgD immunoglobulin-like domain containing protein [Anaerolineales bacterium HSG25]